MKNVIEMSIREIIISEVNNIDVFNIELESLEKQDDLCYIDFDSNLIHHNCLRKDSIQLASWQNGATFSLGYDASLVNESLPLWVFRKMRKKYKNLNKKVVGILGMSFKADTDDTRDSLSFRMKKILENEVKEVLCSDPYVESKWFVSKDELIKKSDIIILMTPHSEYKSIETTKPVIDIWNFLGKGVGI